MEITWKISLLTFGVLWGFLEPTRGDSILFLLPVNSYSHKVAMWPLAAALASRGHSVTFLSPHPDKTSHPNITELVPPSVEKFSQEIQESLLDVQVRVNHQLPQLLSVAYDYAYDSCAVLYEAPEFQTWLQANSQIDLVIADNCLAVECGVGAAYKLGAKVIVFSTVVVFPYEYDAYGYLPESSAVPEMNIEAIQRPMGFWTRVSNAVMSIQWHMKYRNYYASKMDALIKDKLHTGYNTPSIADLVKNVSLIFYTGDTITDYPRTLPSKYVNIAGIHCKDTNQSLTQDLEDFLEADAHGFVYISLGSLVSPSKLPDRVKQTFFQTIDSFPELKFLWRWDSEFPKNPPKNLRFAKWFPQNDLLAHKSIRAFVTQGGRPSTLEAIWHGVPMINFPILGDQDHNANRLVEMGATTKLEIVTVTVEELREAINKTVYDSTMKHRLVELKKLFRDRPSSPLETAVWWTEYVLRTPDTSHLQPAGHDQSWYVRRQIDVWAFLTVLFLTGVACSLFILCKVTTFIFLQNGDKKLKVA